MKTSKLQLYWMKFQLKYLERFAPPTCLIESYKRRVLTSGIIPSFMDPTQ